MVINNKLKSYRNKVYKTRFSLELEAEFPEKVDIMVLRQRYRKLLHSWTVTTDGSLNNGLEFKPRDINKLKFTKEGFAEISEILHIIRKHNGTCLSKKCGLHIHVNMKSFSSTEIIKIIKEMVAKQKYMVKDFKVSKERLEHYCKYITKNSLKGLTPEVLDIFRNGNSNIDVSYLQSKYFILNAQSLKTYGTIEFRLFNGTKYLKDIKRAVKYIFEFLINALERE